MWFAFDCDYVHRSTSHRSKLKIIIKTTTATTTIIILIMYIDDFLNYVLIELHYDPCNPVLFSVNNKHLSFTSKF